jgi:hypothetical protein
MKRKGAEGFPAGQQVTAAANEEFTEIVSGAERLPGTRRAWDPYEVWRTRVKAFSKSKSEQERNRLR